MRSRPGPNMAAVPANRSRWTRTVTAGVTRNGERIRVTQGDSDPAQARTRATVTSRPSHVSVVRLL